MLRRILCFVVLAGALSMIAGESAVAQKMTKQQAAAACRQQLGTGSLPGAGQRDLNMCIRSKMGATAKKKK
jgi:hypothetical protein